MQRKLVLALFLFHTVTALWFLLILCFSSFCVCCYRPSY